MTADEALELARVRRAEVSAYVDFSSAAHRAVDVRLDYGTDSPEYRAAQEELTRLRQKWARAREDLSRVAGSGRGDE